MLCFVTRPGNVVVFNDRETIRFVKCYVLLNDQEMLRFVTFLARWLQQWVQSWSHCVVCQIKVNLFRESRKFFAPSCSPTPWAIDKLVSGRNSIHQIESKDSFTAHNTYHCFLGSKMTRRKCGWRIQEGSHWNDRIHDSVTHEKL